jgi:hypothetical protein
MKLRELVVLIVTNIVYILAVILILPLLLIFGFYVLVSVNERADADNPMRRPAEEIRAELFELTPIGTSMEDVIRVIDNNETWDWHERNISSFGFPDGIHYGQRVVMQSIQVQIGYYWAWKGVNSKAYVTAWWGFDEDENLIDIRVRGIGAS